MKTFQIWQFLKLMINGQFSAAEATIILPTFGHFLKFYP